MVKPYQYYCEYKLKLLYFIKKERKKETQKLRNSGQNRWRGGPSWADPVLVLPLVTGCYKKLCNIITCITPNHHPVWSVFIDPQRKVWSKNALHAQYIDVRGFEIELLVAVKFYCWSSNLSFTSWIKEAIIGGKMRHSVLKYWHWAVCTRI